MQPINSKRYAVLVSESAFERPALTRLTIMLRRLGLSERVSVYPLINGGIAVDALDGEDEIVAIITRSLRSRITDATVEGIDGGCPIMNLSAGVDHINIQDETNKRLFDVYSVPSAASVSQLAFTFIQQHYQNFSANVSNMSEGKFEAAGLIGSLSGKVHTLYGRKKQARDMIALLTAAGISKIKVWSPHFTEDDIAQLRASAYVPEELRISEFESTKAILEQQQEIHSWLDNKIEFTSNIFEAADCNSASIHYPYKDSGFYHGFKCGPLFTASYLRCFENTALVNVGRGEHVDELAIINALDKGNLAAYLADVLMPQVEYGQDVSKSPIWTAQTGGDFGHRLVLTPHIGNTSEEFEKCCNQLINIVVRRIYMSETVSLPGRNLDPLTFKI